MLHVMKHKPLMFGAVLLMVAMAMAQSQRERETLSVQGYEGQASVILYQGRGWWTCKIWRESQKALSSFEEDRIILTLVSERSLRSRARDAATKSGFSPAFMRAAIRRWPQ